MVDSSLKPALLTPTPTLDLQPGFEAISGFAKSATDALDTMVGNANSSINQDALVSADLPQNMQAYAVVQNEDHSFSQQPLQSGQSVGVEAVGVDTNQDGTADLYARLPNGAGVNTQFHVEIDGNGKPVVKNAGNAVQGAFNDSMVALAENRLHQGANYAEFMPRDEFLRQFPNLKDAISPKD